jgi:hypothetical protein
MRHLRWAAIAGVALLCLAPLHARAASKGASGHDLSGVWQLDRSKSDSPIPPQGMGMGHGDGGGMHQGGGHHGGGGMGGPPTAGMGGPPPGDTPEGGPPRERGEGGQRGGGDGGMRRPGLPPFVRITSSATEVAIADSAGTMVQEIMLNGVPDDAPTVEKHAPRVPGEWKGDKLTVTRTNSRGTKVTETFSLADAGQTLVVQTKMEREGGGGFEFKRVYRKAGA